MFDSASSDDTAQKQLSLSSDSTSQEELFDGVIYNIDGGILFKPDKRPQRLARIKVNVTGTKYSVVKKAVQSMGWKAKNLSEDESSWDLSWRDRGITAEEFKKLKPHQKVNMYPGIKCITKKHNLAKNLMRMSKACPGAYDFFPKTWVLP